MYRGLQDYEETECITIVRPLMLNHVSLLRHGPENGDGRDGPVALVCLHHAQALHNPHAGAHAPEDGVLAVQPGGGCKGDEELQTESRWM